MNFIVASLLLHCTEEIAFWLFVSLIEDYFMRDIYQPNLPGLYKHISILDQLMQQHIPELSDHLNKINVKGEMYCSDWIFALYANVIPAE